MKMKKKQPLEISIVMDVSGSMSGTKLESAKKAIKKVLKHLTPEDKVHLVTFNGGSYTIFKNGDLREKENLQSQLEKLKASGSTNIMSGLKKRGYSLIMNEEITENQSNNDNGGGRRKTSISYMNISDDDDFDIIEEERKEEERRKEEEKKLEEKKKKLN